MISEMLRGIYTEKLKDPNHPVNRHLNVDSNYRVSFDIRKKVVDPSMTRGFNDYYNNYFKTLCHSDRQKAVDVAREVVKKKMIDGKTAKAFSGDGMANLDGQTYFGE